MDLSLGQAEWRALCDLAPPRQTARAKPELTVSSISQPAPELDLESCGPEAASQYRSAVVCRGSAMS